MFYLFWFSLYDMHIVLVYQLNVRILMRGMDISYSAQLHEVYFLLQISTVINNL